MQEGGGGEGRLQNQKSPAGHVMGMSGRANHGQEVGADGARHFESERKFV